MYLKRNTRWAPDKSFEGEWTCVPTEDFKQAYDALNAPTPEAVERATMQKCHDLLGALIRRIGYGNDLSPGVAAAQNEIAAALAALRGQK